MHSAIFIASIIVPILAYFKTLTVRHHLWSCSLTTHKILWCGEHIFLAEPRTMQSKMLFSFRVFNVADATGDFGCGSYGCDVYACDALSRHQDPNANFQEHEWSYLNVVKGHVPSTPP